MSAGRHAWMLLAPLPATVVGAAVASVHGVSNGVFLPNVAAILVGAVGAIGLVSSRSEVESRAARWLPVVAFLVIAATLVMVDLDGVRRWLLLGPLRLNASAALLPWVFLGMISPEPRDRTRAVVIACAVQLVHLAQPDAAQATALAAGVLPLLVGGTVVKRRIGIPIAALLVGLAAAAWTRPDTLPAVDHVERILVLAAESGTWWSVAAGVATFGLLAPAMIAMRQREAVTSQLGAGLTLYACATIGATFYGSYPVPVLGAGAGPVLGWYAMITVIAMRLTTR
jgi:cell division protein FtsW (lipid II flippase)